MSLFDQLGKAPQADPREQQRLMQRDIEQVKAHPASFLKEKGMNIPDGMTDATQITQYLLQTGQIGPQRLRAVMQMLQRR